MTRSPATQLGLFGAPSAHGDGLYRVSAHTRILANGHEVFVSEHLRHGRGATPMVRGPRRAASAVVSDDQLDLFVAGPSPTDG